MGRLQCLVNLYKRELKGCLTIGKYTAGAANGSDEKSCEDAELHDDG